MIEYRDVVGFICKLCTGFFNSMINIFILRCVDTETEDYYYYFADQPTRYSSPYCLYNKKLGLLRLNEVLSRFMVIPKDKQLPFCQSDFMFLYYLNVVSVIFLLVCFISLKETTCDTRKKVLYFTSKFLFVLEIIKF